MPRYFLETHVLDSLDRVTAPGLSSPPNPGAVYSSQHTAASQPSTSVFNMLHTSVVLFALCSLSFCGGICFTLMCLNLFCCSNTKGFGNKKEMPVKVPAQPAKRPRNEETNSNNTPAAKRARGQRPEDSKTALEKGHAKSSIITVPWPLPASLP